MKANGRRGRASYRRMSTKTRLRNSSTFAVSHLAINDIMASRLIVVASRVEPKVHGRKNVKHLPASKRLHSKCRSKYLIVVHKSFDKHQSSVTERGAGYGKKSRRWDDVIGNHPSD